jgi:hypothetical protein
MLGVHFPWGISLAAYSTVAMIAGLAALRSTHFGSIQPSRDAFVEEFIQAILRGSLHRQGQAIG